VNKNVENLLVSTVTIATVAVFVAPGGTFFPSKVIKDIGKFVTTAISDVLGTRSRNAPGTGGGIDITATFNMMGVDVATDWYAANYSRLSAAERQLAEQWLATH
jgi:hypothetical protein